MIIGGNYVENYFSRPLMAEERKYTFRSCPDIEARSGLIGYMKINMPDVYEKAYKKWFSLSRLFDTEIFQEEFQEIISVIGLTFPNSESLRVYYNTHLSLSFSDSSARYAGMRISTAKYSYLLRINPCSDIDNVLIFCYIQDRLKGHIMNAAKGIRFVDKQNREIFTIRDGEGIMLYPSTVKVSFSCRYIDPFTCRIGSKKWNLRDFAEYMAKAGKMIVPT